MLVRLLHYSDLEHAFDDPTHAARVAAVIDERRCPRTLVLGTGDNTAPSVLGGESKGRQALDFFNAVSTDFETFGNHDFDHGLDAARALVRDAPNQWLTANVLDSDGRRFGDPHTAPWTVVDIDGVSVGLVGVTTATTPLHNLHAASLTVADPVAAAADALDELRATAGDLDFVIVLAHVGESGLADALDVDVVLDGHRHDPVVSRHDGTVYVRTGDGGMQLAELTLSGDEIAVEQHVVAESSVPPDATLEEALRARITAAGLDEVVAHVEESLEQTAAALYATSSPLGNAVADAVRWATAADVAVVPVGVLHEGPPLSGDVTAFDLHRLAPFDDEWRVVEVSGSDLEAVLRDLLLVEPNAGTDADAVEQFGHVSGLTAVWNDEQATLGDVRLAGKPLDDDTSYTLATAATALRSDHRLPALDGSTVVSTYDGEHPLVAYVRWAGLETDGEIRLGRTASSTDSADSDEQTPQANREDD